MKLDNQDKILLTAALQQKLEKIKAELHEHTNDYSSKWNDFKENKKIAMLENRDRVARILNELASESGDISWPDTQ